MKTPQYSTWAKGLLQSDISKVLSAAGEPGMMSLAPGVPFPAAYPAEKVAELSGRIVRDRPETVFPYGHPQGTLRCREAVVHRMAQRGVETGTDNIVMTSGSQNACDMLLRMLMEPGDVMVVGAPTFLGVLDSVKSWGFSLAEVPVDRDGMNTGALRETLARLKKEGTPAKIIYVMSNYHNPAGVMMSEERRRELPAIAREFDCLIMEDDAYSELNYDRVEQTPVKAWDDEGRVLYLGSFSKLVAPGIRVGWAVAPDEIVKTWNVCRPMMDVGSPALNQEIIAELHVDGWLDGHIEGLIHGYRLRRDALLGALEEFMPRGCSWTVPPGGFYSWVTTPDRIDHDRLFHTAVKHKVMYFTGNFFYLDHRHHNNFRLCFSLPPEDVIREAVKRIGDALREEMAGT